MWPYSLTPAPDHLLIPQPDPGPRLILSEATGHLLLTQAAACPTSGRSFCRSSLSLAAHSLPYPSRNRPGSPLRSRQLGCSMAISACCPITSLCAFKTKNCCVISAPLWGTLLLDATSVETGRGGRLQSPSWCWGAGLEANTPSARGVQAASASSFHFTEIHSRCRTYKNPSKKNDPSSHQS